MKQSYETFYMCEMESRMYKSDTICAVATGLGRSAIGIIRVSGPEAIQICDKVFVGKKRISEMKSFTAAFGKICDGDKVLDEAIVLVMKGPKTYTTEDTVELDLHGGPYALRCVMDLLVTLGVRVAEPGEFTKRAFLGGRIDMTEAEAVMDVINAETERSLSTSLSQLSGKLRDEVVSLREKILYHTAFIEAALDDPENYVLDEEYNHKLEQEVRELKARIEKDISTSEEGRILREGIRTAIVGRPNVGKSSMLNRLLGEERAIVTEIEGTTRDTLEEYVSIGGALLRLIDTAGIRETDDTVERIGVDKARDAIESADLILMLLDGTSSLTDEDREIISGLSGKEVIVLINKSDLSDASTKSDSTSHTTHTIIEENELTSCLQDAEVKGYHIINTSAKTGQGMEELTSLIGGLFFSQDIDYNNQVYVTRARHKNALTVARDSLGKVLDSIEVGLGEDFLTIDLMAAYESLGDIIGETLQDDRADRIFSEFCMGK